MSTFETTESYEDSIRQTILIWAKENGQESLPWNVIVNNYWNETLDGRFSFEPSIDV